MQNVKNRLEDGQWEQKVNSHFLSRYNSFVPRVLVPRLPDGQESIECRWVKKGSLFNGALHENQDLWFPKLELLSIYNEPTYILFHKTRNLVLIWPRY